MSDVLWRKPSAEFFPMVRDALLKRMEESVHKHEKVPCRIKGCLNGIAICRKLNSVAELKGEIQARRPEGDHLDKKMVSVAQASTLEDFGGAYADYWMYRCASAQIEWAYEVLRLGFDDQISGEPFSARAMLMLKKVLSDVKGA